MNRGSMPLLQVEGMTKAFGAVRAVNQVSLDLSAGDVLGIIGPNGSGKSTLINTLSGVLRPDSGRVLLNGLDVTNWSIQRRARAGLVRTFQNLRLNDELTVRDNLAAGLERSGGLSGRERSRRVDSMLEELGMLRDARSLARGMSLGQRRRLELGRALISEPSVVLLDEPAAGLDQQERTEFIATIQRHITRLGGAAVVVEHDMSLLRQLCPASIVMQTGEVIFRGLTSEALLDDRVVASYLGGSSDA